MSLTMMMMSLMMTIDTFLFLLSFELSVQSEPINVSIVPPLSVLLGFMLLACVADFRFLLLFL